MAVSGNVMVISDPAKGHKLNYEDLEDRMKTFKLSSRWDGLVEYQSMADAGFVYTGQEDIVFCFSCNIKLDRWSKDMDPLLRHKEESPTCSFMRHKLQAVKGERGKAKSVIALSERIGINVSQVSSESNYGNPPVSELIVNDIYTQKKLSNHNLHVQTEQDEFSSRRTSLPSQASTEEVQVVPWVHFMHVTQPGILSFVPDWTTVGHGNQQSRFPVSEDRGVIYPPNFDVPVPSTLEDTLPVQSSEVTDHSAVLINTPSSIKKSIADCHPLAELHQCPKPTSALFSLVKKQDGQLIERSDGMDLRKLVCQICMFHTVKYLLLPCGHARTCRSCTKHFINRPCPFCRQLVSAINIIRF